MHAIIRLLSRGQGGKEYRTSRISFMQGILVVVII